MSPIPGSNRTTGTVNVSLHNSRRRWAIWRVSFCSIFLIRKPTRVRRSQFHQESPMRGRPRRGVQRDRHESEDLPDRRIQHWSRCREHPVREPSVQLPAARRRCVRGGAVHGGTASARRARPARRAGPRGSITSPRSSRIRSGGCARAISGPTGRCSGGSSGKASAFANASARPAVALGERARLPPSLSFGRTRRSLGEGGQGSGLRHRRSCDRVTILYSRPSSRSRASPPGLTTSSEIRLHNTGPCLLANLKYT